ncbi:MAG: DUF116 domain-containing protein, partial [Candidatus Woesearchaeota archaeon]|nr:DUF116 domain-containing protein [Candidatus Woesearchaeota archaeon]
KLKFITKLALFRVSPLLKRLGINYDISKILNTYYKDEFKKIQVNDRAVLLPHCLIHKNCPAKFSKEEGVLCINCKLCRCGEIKELCQKEGYQFYITPSMGFTKRLISRKEIRAVIGSTCDYEINKEMKNEKVNSKGLELKDKKVIPQLLRLNDYNCINNDMDWDKLKIILKES